MIICPHTDEKILPCVTFVRGNSLFLNIIKVLFQNDIVAEVTISELVVSENKDRRSIANECYEIVKNNLENNAN